MRADRFNSWLSRHPVDCDRSVTLMQTASREKKVLAMCSNVSGRLLMLFAVGLAIVPLNASGAGRTSGSFAVSPSGSATYSIPIWTPPGPNGVQPSISLDYSSQGGNGLAGVGWNLSAAAAIERCNRTKHQDGEAGEVTLTLADRFCLGGNRLRVVSGSYGAADSVYHTELADFSRITAYGSNAGTGPEYFIVEAKNGLKYEYGVTTNSRVFPGVSPTISTTVNRWMLSKVSDRNGNNYVISYINSNGFAVPDVISWTPTSSSTYRYEAKFNYINTRANADSYWGRVAGFEVRNNYRLENIQIKSAGAVVRKYRLTYGTSSVTSRSRLASAKECADDAESNCLLPITFSYQTGVAGVTAGAGTAPAGSSNSLIQGRFDFNGDGKDDVLYKNGTTWYAAFGASSGFGGPYSTGITGTALPDRFLPNGRDAIATIVSGNLWIYRWDDASSSFTGVNTGIASAAPSLASDYNADGLADLVYFTSGNATLSIRANTSTGSINPSFATSMSAINTLPSAPPPNNTYWGGLMTSINFGQSRVDFNGDGRQDLYAVIVTASQFGATVSYVNLLAQNSGYLSVTGQVLSMAGPVNFAPALDFNGDKCSDLLHLSTVYVAPCKAAAATSVAAPATASLLLDWNGDGKTDLLTDSGGTYGVYLSTGAGFSSLISTSIPSGGGFAIDQDGDKLDDVVKGNGTGALSYWTHTANGSVPAFASNIPDLLTSVTDGFGVNRTVSYVSTASSSNYDKGTATSYPLQEAPNPHIVVAQVTSSDGIGTTYNKTYYYSGARENAERRESAGFQRVEETDNRTSFTTKKYFEQAFPLIGMLKETEIFQPNGTTRIARSTLTNTPMTLEASGTGALLRAHRYVSIVLSEQYEVAGDKNGELITTVEEKFENVDAYGNVGKVTRTVTDNDDSLSPSGQQWKTETVHQFAPPVGYCLDFTTDSTVTDTAPGGSIVERTVHNEPDGSNCRILSTRVGPSASLYRVETDYEYDDYGNVRLITLKGVNPDGTPMDDRETEIDWDNYGLFPESVTNALEQTTQFGHNYELGLPTSTTDPNGLIASRQYDPFGRITSESLPDGTSTSWTYQDCADAGGCFNARHKTTITQTESTGAVSITYLDQFERAVVTRQKLMNGSFQWNESQYDALGRVLKQSIPCATSSTTLSCVANWVISTYDSVGRITSSSRPIDAETPATQTTTYEYAGRTITTTDPQNRETTKITDPTGVMRVSTDANDYSQFFAYDAGGSLTAVTDSDGRSLFTATYEYGIKAFQKTASDPDLGPRTQTYDSLGQLRSWTDAAGHAFTAGYDPLSRITSRTDPANGSVPAMTSTFNWGFEPAKHNIGQLESMQATVGTATYTDAYVYDSSGRLLERNITIPGDATHSYEFEYAGGRLDTLTYPLSTGSNPLRLKYAYSQENGQLQSVSDADTPSTVFWTANLQNALGQIAEDTLGNGIKRTRTFDAITGWLSKIQAGPAGNETALQNTSYNYDLVGNLIQRQNDRLSITEDFFYGDGANDKLYRLNHSTRLFNGQTTENLRLTYDSLGNILTKTEAGTHDAPIAQEIAWTSYNHPASINATTTGEMATFSYGPDRQRWKMVFDSASGSETTYYIGGLMEKVIAGSLTDYRHHIYVGGEPIAVYSRNSANENNLRYVLSDHQGSIDTLAFSPNTRVLDESFTAFGLRRDASSWSGQPSASDRQLADGITRQGYTFQTVLGRMGLNHMNGRVQDAVIGRFLSPDPYVTQPGYTQSFNRYAYVYNNPLTYVDPSGFGPELLNCSFTNISISLAFSYGHLDMSEFGRLSASFTSNFSSYGACYYVTPPPHPSTIVTTSSGPAQTSSTDSVVAWSGIGFAPDQEAGAADELNDWICDFGIADCGDPFVLDTNVLGTDMQAGTVLRTLRQLLKGGPKKPRASPKSPAKPTNPIRKPPNVSAERMKHVLDRHGPNSTAKNVGRWSKGTSETTIRGQIDEAARKGLARPNTQGRPGEIREYDFGRTIGTNSKGEPTSRLRVVVDELDNLITAFPY
jgi:RHS repeat-associated protein